MPNLNLTKLKPKNYLSFITELPGSRMWRHLFVVDENGDERDAVNDGELSGAYMVSSVLTIFKVIDKPHTTVETTLQEMEKSGWQKVDKPVKGAVVRWDTQIGFYLADDFVVSNSSFEKAVVRHGLVLGDGQKPTAFYTHPELI